MAFQITATTVDGYIKQALDALTADDFLGARKYVVLAQTAKKALPQEMSQDGMTRRWDSMILDVLNGIEVLEAHYKKSQMQTRLGRARISRGTGPQSPPFTGRDPLTDY